jgi:hypothetical protein
MLALIVAILVLVLLCLGVLAFRAMSSPSETRRGNGNRSDKQEDISEENDRLRNLYLFYSSKGRVTYQHSILKTGLGHEDELDHIDLPDCGKNKGGEQRTWLPGCGSILDKNVDKHLEESGSSHERSRNYVGVHLK